MIAAGGDPAQGRVLRRRQDRRRDATQALDAGILCFNVESAAELERLDAVAARSAARARRSASA